MKARIERLLSHLPFRREGLAAAGLVLGILLTGLGKSINLILLLGSLLAAVLVVNLVLARRQLRSLDVARILPDLAFAGDKFAWRLRVRRTDGKRILGVSLEDPLSGKIWHVDDLERRRSAFLDANATLRRRGVARWQPMKASSSYPFGLAYFETLVGREDEIVVAPRLGALNRGKLRHWLRMHSPSQGLARVALVRHPAAQMEIHGLRPFRPGDSPRWVHWRTSARRGEIMVREFEDLPNDHLLLVVDPIVPAGQTTTPQLERTLALAATIIHEWCRQKGDRFMLALAGPKPRLVQGTTGQPFLVDALRALAVVECGPATDAGELARMLADPALPAAATLLACSEPSRLADVLAAETGRHVAVLDVSAGDDLPFFDWEPPAETTT